MREVADENDGARDRQQHEPDHQDEVTPGRQDETSRRKRRCRRLKDACGPHASRFPDRLANAPWARKRRQRSSKVLLKFVSGNRVCDNC
jgi:hypothetical protein